MSEIKVEQDGYVATLTLNRPEAMNTITQPMLASLSSHLIACDENPGVRAIIITGEGRAFCAGLDLNDAASEEGVSKGGFALAAKLDLKTFPPNVAPSHGHAHHLRPEWRRRRFWYGPGIVL